MQFQKRFSLIVLSLSVFWCLRTYPFGWLYFFPTFMEIWDVKQGDYRNLTNFLNGCNLIFSNGVLKYLVSKWEFSQSLLMANYNVYFSFPKSTIKTFWSSFIKLSVYVEATQIFSGLMSRCTIPMKWIDSIARITFFPNTQTWLIICYLGEQVVSDLKRWWRLGPSRSSMIIQNFTYL